MPDRHSKGLKPHEREALDEALEGLLRNRLEAANPPPDTTSEEEESESDRNLGTSAHCLLTTTRTT